MGRAGGREDVLAAEVIDDVQVGQSVAVEIGQHAAHRPLVPTDSRRTGLVTVGPVAVVDQQCVAADVGHVDIGKPVAVDVSGRHSLPVVGLVELGLQRDVLEPSVGGISEQAIGGRDLGRCDRRP